ncbi:MAG TPA: heavy metal translocating P-type ATPase [Thermodesulfovibrionales bacterium]|nr:heavy metal translocating P-type ATPase [Thermodesulfovibrionales bacterium]
MATLKCDHCLLTFSEGQAIHDEVKGVQRVFCCNGCRGIYRLIHDEGLDAFYERRNGWTPGPPEEGDVSTDLFEAALRTEGNKAALDLNLTGIRCASCIWLIEHFLMKCDGILSVMVNYATHRARIAWLTDRISLATILKKIASLGYAPRPYSGSAIEEALKGEKRDLLIRFGTASFLSMQLMLYTTALYAGYFEGIDPLYRKMFELISWAFTTPVIFYCGYPFLRNSVKGIGNRAFTMDALIFIGSFSAYAYSVFAIFTGGEVYFDTAAMIITLILLGRFLETGAKVKAIGAISSLISLQPKEARIMRQSDSGEPFSESVPVSTLKVGDRIEVIAGERIPVDCVVLGGHSEADESMLTGESVPVRKTESSAVFGGTMNLTGSLVLEVKKVGSDTLLSGIIRAVEDAQARKAPIQKLADIVAGWFVPAIFLVAGMTFGFWFLRTHLLSVSLVYAVSVLVIACPCALGLATPLAILISTTILSSRGVLVKGGDSIETVARTNFVSFDKTGTLTAGIPSLMNLATYGISRGELHILAASLERGSVHPIAHALRKGMRDEDLYRIESSTTHPGKGIEGLMNGRRLLAGNPSFLQSSGVVMSDTQMEDFAALSSGGDTITGFAEGAVLRGWLVLSNDLRPEVPEVVERLRQLGCGVGLLTGDRNAVAEEIGRKAGISIMDAEATPVQKADKVRLLREAGQRVLMVGDGINDAPALVEADAGVAIGSATDIAMESADVVLLRNDLRSVITLLAVSKRTFSLIRQNLFWAFSYNLVAVPLAVSGKIHPIISAACMAISSLIVVGNSLRLYKTK